MFSMEPLAYSKIFSPANTISPMSQPQRMESCMAFFIRPAFRRLKVICRFLASVIFSILILLRPMAAMDVLLMTSVAG